MEMETAYGRELQLINFSFSLTNLPHPSSGATCDYQGEMFLLIKTVSSLRIYFRLIRLQNFTFENFRPDESKFHFTDNEVHAAGNFFETYSFHVYRQNYFFHDFLFSLASLQNPIIRPYIPEISIWSTTSQIISLKSALTFIYNHVQISPSAVFPIRTTCSCHLIFVVPCIMLYSGEISPTRCNNCVFYSQWLYSTCFG